MWRSALILFVGVLLFLGVGYFALFKRSLIFQIKQSLLLRGKTELFVVRDISCKTQFGSCEEADEKVLESFKGVNFFSVRVGEVERSLLSHLKNKRVLIYKVFPSSLKVNIQKRAARIALKRGFPDSSGEGYWLVDFDGVVLEKSENSALPLMYVGDMYLGLGLELRGEKKRAFRLLYKTYQVVPADWGVMEEGFLIVSLLDGSVVKYSLERDVDVSVGSLQLVSSATRMDGEMPKEIDLRFKNAVLRYK